MFSLIIYRVLIYLYLFIYSYTMVYTLIDNNTLENNSYNNKTCTCNHNTILNKHIGYRLAELCTYTN